MWLQSLPGHICSTGQEQVAQAWCDTGGYAAECGPVRMRQQWAVWPLAVSEPAQRSLFLLGLPCRMGTLDGAAVGQEAVSRAMEAQGSHVVSSELCFCGIWTPDGSGMPGFTLLLAVSPFMKTLRDPHHSLGFQEGTSDGFRYLCAQWKFFSPMPPERAFLFQPVRRPSKVANPQACPAA